MQIWLSYGPLTYKASATWVIHTWNGVDYSDEVVYPHLAEALNRGDLKPLELFCKLQGYNLHLLDGTRLELEDRRKQHEDRRKQHENS